MKKILFAIAFITLGISVFALKPSKNYSAKPSDYGITYQEVKIETEDNLTLKGWFYETAKPSNKIVIISGNGDGNMADYIEIATNFTSLGFNVLTYDYRGYGESQDFKINENFYIYAQFEKDLNAAINWVRKYNSKMKTVDLYGMGIGGALSIAVGANRGGDVFQVIADSPYSKLEDIKKKIKEIEGKDVLLPLGYNKYMLEPYYALESKGTGVYSVLFICGELDNVYTIDDTKALSKVQKNRSQVFVVKGATRFETFTKDKNAYFEEIKNYLKTPQ